MYVVRYNREYMNIQIYDCWFQEPKPGVAALSKPIGTLHMGQPKHRTHAHVECLQQEEAKLPSIHCKGNFTILIA